MFDQASLFAGWQCLHLNGAELRYWPNWLGQSEQADYWQAFQYLAWEQSTIRMAGRDIAIPRLNAWYGDREANYGYSGVQLRRHCWTKELQQLRRDVENVVGESFNAVLANLYRDGQDSVDWHADDEPELGAEPVIASVSLGVAREFKMKHRRDRSLKPVTIELTPGSLLVMSGAAQANWLHKVPKTARPVGSRINLTFRFIKPVVTGKH